MQAVYHAGATAIILSVTALPYQARYCEENVWQQLGDPALSQWLTHALLISNAQRCCPMWAQRSAEDPTEPVGWDYHVIGIGEGPPPQALDLDCVLGPKLPFARWLDITFPMPEMLPEHYAPHFRLVTAADYRARFSSDRSHMRKDGAWLAPPPPWPAITPEGHNLAALIDMERDFLGERYDLPGLRARFNLA